MNSSLLIVVISLGFLAVSKSILVASGKAPAPKPMTKRDKNIFYFILFAAALAFILSFYLLMYADGMLDFDFF